MNQTETDLQRFNQVRRRSSQRGPPRLALDVDLRVGRVCWVEQTLGTEMVDPSIQGFLVGPLAIFRQLTEYEFLELQPRRGSMLPISGFSPDVSQGHEIIARFLIQVLTGGRASR